MFLKRLYNFTDRVCDILFTAAKSSVTVKSTYGAETTSAFTTYSFESEWVSDGWHKELQTQAEESGF